LARSGRSWVWLFGGAGSARGAASRRADGRQTRFLGKPEHALAGGPDRRRSSWLASGCYLIGYVTVSPGSTAYETERSAAAIQAKCERFAWNLLENVHDRDTGRLRERPGLRYALERIVRRDADGLVVADLRGLSRSLVDLGALLAWFRDAHATLIAVDLGIDTSTPEGDQVASALIALGTYERERIASRPGPDCPSCAPAAAARAVPP
jgi:hypothetical protein